MTYIRLPCHMRYSTIFTQHKRVQAILKKYGTCTLCPLHERRNKPVLLHRGYAPCRILFIGEAPGRSEDSVGVPFIGDAGRRVLDPMIEDTFTHIGRRYSWAIQNVVACMPEEKDPEGNWQLRAPTKDECLACRPRLLQFLDFANPNLLILMGKPAAKYFPPERLARQPTLEIWHPSYILRSGGKQSPKYKQTVLQIVDFLNSHKKELSR